MAWSVQRRTEPKVIPMCTTTGGDLSPWLIGCTIRRPFGGKATFSASFRQYAGSSGDDTSQATGADAFLQKVPSGVNPFPSGGSYQIKPHNFSQARKVNFHFIVAADEGGNGGVHWTSPTFLPGAPSFDGDVLQWSGADLTTLLDKENQALDDIIMDQPIPVKKYAIAAIKEQCTAAGITQVVCNFKDYLLRILRRTGMSYASMNGAITKVRQAFPHMKGDVLVYSAAKATGGATWSFIDELNLYTATPRIDDTIKNRFTITRGEPQPGIIGTAECRGPHCLGRTIDAVLDPPSSSVQVHIEGDMIHASILNFAYFEEGKKPGSLDDNGVEGNALPAAGVGGLYTGHPPAARCKATYLEALNPTDPGGDIFGGNAGSLSQVEWEPWYKVTFFGGGQAGSVGISTKYTFAKTDTSGTVAIIGIREEYGNIEDVIIPDEITAKEYLDALLYENCRRVWCMDAMSYYFNPLIEPGDTVVIYDFLTSQEGISWFVQEIRLVYAAATSVDSAPDFHIEMDLTRGPV